MCVRFFVRLLIVYALIISKNQACCHGGSSKSLASANPKFAPAIKAAAEKEVDEVYPKKPTDGPNHWTESEWPLASPKQQQQQQQASKDKRAQAVLRSDSSERQRYDADRYREAMVSNGKSYSKTPKDSFEQDLAREVYRITSGWDEDERLRLKDIDKKRLQTITADDPNSRDYSSESDYYERVAPRLKDVTVGQQNPRSENEHRRFDSDHIKEFNIKKMKALESFEDRDYVSSDLQNNQIGELNKKFAKGQVPTNQKVEEDIMNSEELEYLLNHLTSSEEFSTGGENEMHNHKVIAGESIRNQGSQNSKQKSTADIMDEYGDVLQKVEEIYKLLNPHKTSGAKNSGYSSLYDSSTEANPKQNPRINSEISFAEYSRRKPGADSEFRYPEYSEQKLGNNPDYARRKPDDAELGYREYARRQPETYPEYSKQKPEARSDYVRRIPEVDPERFYHDFSSEEYSYQEPKQRNLASPQCKFEHLNPSLELVSEEEDRNLQFRSPGSRKSSNSIGQNRKSVQGSGLAAAGQNQNNDRKSYTDLNENRNSKLSASRHGKKYQNDVDGAGIALSPYKARSNVNFDDFAGKPWPKLGTSGARYFQNVGQSKKPNEKSFIGSNRQEESEFNLYNRKVGSTSLSPEKSTVAAKFTGKYNYPESDLRGVPSNQRLGDPYSMVATGRASTADFDDAKGISRAHNERVGNRKKENTLGSPRDKLSMHEPREKAAMNRVQHLNFKNGGSRQYSLEDEDVPERIDMSGVAPSAGMAQQANLHPQGTEVQYPHITAQIQETPHGSFGGSPVDQTQIIGSPHPGTGFEHVGTGQMHETVATPVATPVAAAVPQLPASAATVSAQATPGEGGPCTSVFKCLAEMGQTLINPLTTPDTQVSQAVPQTAQLEHLALTDQRFSDDLNPAGLQDFTRDASGGTKGFFGGLADRLTAARSGPETGNFGSNFMQEHPFYCMVSSLLEAAQEATKQRILESRHANLKSHPERIQLAQPKTPAMTPIPEMPVPPAQNLPIAPQPGITQSGQNAVTSISTPGNLNNLKDSGKKPVTKPGSLVGNVKKASILGNSATGNGKLVSAVANGKALGSPKTDFLNKLKASPKIGTGKVQQSNPKVNSIGSITQRVADSRKMSLPKNDAVKTKVGAFKKVDFQPVSLTTSNKKSSNGPKIMQSVKASDQKTSSKPDAVGARLKSQKIEPKSMAAAAKMSVATPALSPIAANSAPVTTVNQTKRSPAKQGTATSGSLSNAA